MQMLKCHEVSTLNVISISNGNNILTYIVSVMKLSKMCHLNSYLWHLVIDPLSAIEDVSLNWMEGEIIYYHCVKP